jgi:hypothetical protein
VNRQQAGTEVIRGRTERERETRAHGWLLLRGPLRRFRALARHYRSDRAILRRAAGFSHFSPFLGGLNRLESIQAAGTMNAGTDELGKNLSFPLRSPPVDR